MVKPRSNLSKDVNKELSVSLLSYLSLREGNRRVRVGGGSNLEASGLVVERNFAEFFDEWARGVFGKRHEPGLWVRGHGEVALERSSAVSGADPGAEDEGVAAVEGGGWLDDD